jgi:hypothetical protein
MRILAGITDMLWADFTDKRDSCLKASSMA